MHVADDWLYTLWHLATVNAAIPSLAKNHDVFTCSVGDADNSFDFEYFHDGNSVRKYVVEDSEYRRGLVVEDFGSPLPSEAEAMNQPDPLIAVLEIAHSLGINTLHDPTLIRAYTKEHNIRPDR